MSSRNAACRGCDESILGVSVVGVMIYDQMMPELPLKDHVQELKSMCIRCSTTRNLTSQVRYNMYCNTLQHTATHCNTLQHTATHCNTLPYKPGASPNGGPACSGNRHGPRPRATALRWQTDRESPSLFRHANSTRLPYAALLLGAKIVGVGRCVERR